MTSYNMTLCITHTRNPPPPHTHTQTHTHKHTHTNTHTHTHTGGVHIQTVAPYGHATASCLDWTSSVSGEACCSVCVCVIVCVCVFCHHPVTASIDTEKRFVYCVPCLCTISHTRYLPVYHQSHPLPACVPSVTPATCLCTISNTRYLPVYHQSHLLFVWTL